MASAVRILNSALAVCAVSSSSTLPAQTGRIRTDSSALSDEQRSRNVSELVRLRDRAYSLLERDLLAQRAAWQRAEIEAHGEPKRGPESEPEMRRAVNTACNYVGYWPVNLANPRYPNPTIIHSSVVTRRTVCPDWIPPQAHDRKTHEVNGTLRSASQLAPFSAEVIAILDSAHRSFPDDDWILRQLIRVLVEKGRMDDEKSVARDCNVTRFWCLASQGYSAFQARKAVDARIAFKRAMAALPHPERCEWELRPEFATIIASIAERSPWCDERFGLSVNSWWLGNPFLSDSVNWRHLEHYVRRFETAVATDFDPDPWFDLRAGKGSDAILAMYLRYGRPSHMVYMGAKHEAMHSMVNKRSDSAPPYPAPEYTMDRIASLPSLRSALSPLSVVDADFQLVAPDSVASYAWWPAEHFRHPGGTIERVAHQQRALLRRDSTAILLMASDLRDGRIDSIGTAPVRAALAFTPNPDSVAILAQQITTRGSTVVLHGEFGSPGIAGFEYLVDAHGLAGGRTRFGIEHVPTLNAMPLNTCSISDPLLTRADALTGNGITDAFTGLLGSLTLDKPTRLGLVWESYGFAPQDTTKIAVQIVNAKDISTLRRVGMALGVADDPTTSVTIQWEEPRAPATRTVMQTKVPTIARQLALNIERLREGDYVLAVAMEKNGCAPVRSERAFRVVR